MVISVYFEEARQVCFAFLIGAVIGIEREFRSKAAGFRTMILICVGSCIYTILPKEAGSAGMAIGYHNYPLAVVAFAMVVIVLFVPEPVQRVINRLHRVKDYKITTVETGLNFKTELELFFRQHRMSFNCMKKIKKEMDAVYIYRSSSPDRNYDEINNFLLKHTEVRSFEV